MKKLISFVMTVLLTVPLFAETFTVTKQVSEVATEGSWVSSTDTDVRYYPNFKLDKVVTITAKDATPQTSTTWNGVYYANATDATKSDWRMYQARNGGEFTFSVAVGYQLKSITMTYSNKNDGVVGLVSGSSIETKNQVASNAKLTLGERVFSKTLYVGATSTKTNGQARITKFSVEYESVPVDTLYLNTGGSSLWNQAGAKFSVWYWNDGEQGHFTDFLELANGETDIYRAIVPHSDSVIFVRHDAAADVPTWNNKWNQTDGEKVDLEDNGNIMIITGWNQGDFEWDHYTPKEPEPTKIYAKNNWGGVTDWTWREMTTGEDDIYYLDSVVFGGTGVDINTKADDDGKIFFPVDSILVYDADTLLPLDTVLLIYDAEQNRLRTNFIGRPHVPAYTYDTVYSLVGNFTNWAAGAVAMPYNVENVAKDSVLAYKVIRQLITKEDGIETKRDTTWLGQPNEGNQMTRESNAWKLDGGHNVLLTADVEGTYKFEFTPADSVLTVTFPEKPATYEFASWDFIGDSIDGHAGALLQDKMIAGDTLVEDGISLFYYGVDVDTKPLQKEAAQGMYWRRSTSIDRAIVMTVPGGTAATVKYALRPGKTNNNYRFYLFTQDAGTTPATFHGNWSEAIDSLDWKYAEYTKDTISMNVDLTSKTKAQDLYLLFLDLAGPDKKDVRLRGVSYEKVPAYTYDTVYTLAGNFNNWQYGAVAMPYNVENVAKDSVLAYKVIRQLITKEDGIETKRDTTWLGQPNEGNQMTRDNNAWKLDGGYNVLLTADEDGTYTFDFTPADSVLTVTFPATKPQLDSVNTIAHLKACYEAGTLKDNDTIRVKGYIASMFLKPTNFAKYGSVTIWMTDTLGGKAKEFQLYNCYGLEKDTFVYFGPGFTTTGKSNIDVDTIIGRNNVRFVVGDYIEAVGAFKKYGETFELVQGCNIYEGGEKIIDMDTLTLHAGTWANDNAKIAAWVWGGSITGQWTAFFAGEDDVLTATFPAEATNLKFVRFANTVEAPDWQATIWNEGGDETIDPCLEYFANGYGEGDPGPLVGQWCDEPTGIQKIAVEKIEGKILREGQLYIICNGVMYNAIGARIK